MCNDRFFLCECTAGRFHGVPMLDKSISVALGSWSRRHGRRRTNRGLRRAARVLSRCGEILTCAEGVAVCDKATLPQHFPHSCYDSKLKSSAGPESCMPPDQFCNDPRKTSDEVAARDLPSCWRRLITTNWATTRPRAFGAPTRSWQQLERR